MARRKKSYRRKGGGKSAVMKAAIDGAIAGVAPGLVRRFAGNVFGNLTEGITLFGVGYIRKNNTLVTLGAFQLGQSLGSGFMGNGNGNGNGFYE